MGQERRGALAGGATSGVCCRRRAWALASMVVAAGAPWATAGCQQISCNGEAYAPVPGTPQILDVTVSQPLTLDRAPYTDNPWHLLLDVEFEDVEGNLGDGMAFVYLGGSRHVARSFALANFFRSSDLSPTATSGHVGLHMLLPPDQIGDGTTMQMGIQLEDASAPDPGGKFSNCYRLNLDFKVEPVRTAWQRLTGRALGRAHG